MILDVVFKITLLGLSKCSKVILKSLNQSLGSAKNTILLESKDGLSYWLYLTCYERYINEKSIKKNEKAHANYQTRARKQILYDIHMDTR